MLKENWLCLEELRVNLEWKRIQLKKKRAEDVNLEDMSSLAMKKYSKSQK